MTSISKEQLIASAQDFSSRALVAYRDEDQRAILHNAAIAFEHLSKAYLHSLHATLLMNIKNGNLDSLLFLAGVNKNAPRKTYPRTISAREALLRVQAVLPSLQSSEKSLSQLVDVRDGQLHVGFLAPTPTYEVLTAFLRYSNELYDAMEVAKEDRWGEHDEMITNLISVSLTEIERAVHVRITAARQRLDSWIERVPEKERNSVCVARQLAAAPNLGPDEEYETTRCPGCDDQDAYRLGKVELEWRVDEESGDFEGEVDLVGPYLLRHFWPQAFLCGVCELRLTTREEMAAAGIPVNEEADEADPHDYPGEAEDIIGPYR